MDGVASDRPTAWPEWNRMLGVPTKQLGRFWRHDYANLAALTRQGGCPSGSSLKKPCSLVSVFRKRHPRVGVLIEAKSHREVLLAVKLGADIILLDNMTPSRLKGEIGFLRRWAPAVRIEVSGGVNMASVRRLARLGPDRISVGRLTHSAPALDISLDVRPASRTHFPIGRGTAALRARGRVA